MTRTIYDSIEHGRRSVFINHKCRCGPCREANRAYNRKRYAENALVRATKASRSREQRLRGYGLTEDEYAEMIRIQGGVCAICASSPADGDSLCIDHHHGSGEVRGLLCRNCNLAVGNMRDDPARLRKAAAYLERSPR